jgi:hypothetical protein
MTPLNWPVTLVPFSLDTGGFLMPVSLGSVSFSSVIHLLSSVQTGCSTMPCINQGNGYPNVPLFTKSHRMLGLMGWVPSVTREQFQIPFTTHVRRSEHSVMIEHEQRMKR